MGFFENVIAGVLYLVLLLLDLTILFIGIRVLNRRWPSQWLLALDRFGTPLVDLYLEHTIRIARRLGADRISTTVRLILSLGILIVVRSLLIAKG